MGHLPDALWDLWDGSILPCLQAETQLAALKAEHERYMDETAEKLQEMQGRMAELEQKKNEASSKLEEERRYVTQQWHLGALLTDWGLNKMVFFGTRSCVFW